jgi:dihydroflavonol-4-reductase
LVWLATPRRESAAYVGAMRKAFITGATGFIGGQLARELVGRGDQVVALVRSPAKARSLAEAGVELVQGSLDDVDAILQGLDGADAAIHGAGVYEVGIRAAQREPMRRTNIDGTKNVLMAARKAAVPKVVYISTMGIYGDTRGAIVDESYRRSSASFLSY